MRRALLHLLPLTLVLGGVVPTLAQSGLVAVRASASSGSRLQGKVTPSCQGGLKNDDGTAENGLAFDGPPEGPDTVDMVQRLVGGQAGARIEQICICWTRGTTTNDTLDFDLVLYDTAGPGGEPGALLARIPATAAGIPGFPSSKFFDFDISGQGILATTAGFYAGASWRSYLGEAAAKFFLCSDETGPGGQPIYASSDPQAGWENLRDIEGTDPPPEFPTQALLVRAEVDAQATTPCIEGDTTLCLNDGRFQVEIDWRSPTDQGVGMAERLTTDTGYFWFFGQENVEMVIKVLEACGINGHYWVFAGGLTDVEVDITVTDTDTGLVRSYHNPSDTPFQPIQDIEAFATCP